MATKTTTPAPRTTLCGIEFAATRIAKSKVLKILRSGRAQCRSFGYDGFRKDEPVDPTSYASNLENYWPATMSCRMVGSTMHLSTHNGYVAVSEIEPVLAPNLVNTPNAIVGLAGKFWRVNDQLGHFSARADKMADGWRIRRRHESNGELVTSENEAFTRLTEMATEG